MSTSAIELRGVGRRFPGFALGPLDLDVAPGTVMGLVGPNGAGKTTTLRIVMGLARAERGTVRVLGHEMPRDEVAAKRDVAFVSEDMRPHPGETVAFHLRLMASVFPSWDEAYARTLISRFDLDPTRRIRQLSHGQRTKVCLVLALARRPKLLVLDEPTTGLDPLARRQVLDELSAVRADEERAILLSSHNTLDVEQISDRIALIRAGSILFSEDKETLLDGWRRLRLDVPEGVHLPSAPGVVEVRRTGRVALVTVRDHSEELVGALRACGASVHAQERMTLEEIFLASVRDPVGRGADVRDPGSVAS